MTDGERLPTSDASAAGPRASGSVSEMVAAVRLTSLASILTTVLGVVSTKIVAVVASTDGVALIGLYRTFAQLVSSALPLGLNDVVVQRTSTAPSRDQAWKVIEAATFFVLIQSLITFAAAILLGRPLGRLLFGAAAGAHVWEVRWLLVMTAGFILMQAVIAVLNGQGRLREATWVNLITAAATLATVYPFLLLGHVGLPFVLGFTCFIGAAVGAGYVWRGAGARRFSLPGWRESWRRLPLSASLVVRPMLVAGSSLAMQSLILRHYGLELLGWYNAASTIETTAIMVLMSHMRSYYLPTLGRLANDGSKHRFANRAVTLLLAELLLGGMLLILGAPLILRILFSARFHTASDLLIVLTFSMVGQVFAWSAAMFLLHKADYRAFLGVDAVWAILCVAGTWACTHSNQPLIAVAWVHAAGYIASAALYAVVIRHRHRDFHISMPNLLLGAATLAMFLGGGWIAHRSHPLGQVTYLAGVGVVGGLMLRALLRGSRAA